MTLSIVYEGPVASVNDRLRRGRWGGMYLSPRYRAFKRDLWVLLVAEIARSGFQQIRRPDRAVVYLTARLPARMDTDNVWKPILDAIEIAGVVENDRQCFPVVKDRTDCGRGEPPRLILTVLQAAYEAGPPSAH